MKSIEIFNAILDSDWVVGNGVITTWHLNNVINEELLAIMSGHLLPACVPFPSGDPAVFVFVLASEFNTWMSEGII